MNPKPTRAFTLVELLVVIAIIAILVIMLLPAINGLRETARRSQCINKMSQLILALQDYEMAHGVYPPGVTDLNGPIISQEQGLHQGWLIQLLPHLEEGNVYKAIDQQLSVYDKKNKPARSTHLDILTCPSSPVATNVAISDYAGVHHDVEAPINVDQHGVLFLNSRLSHDDVTDGMRYTLFIGEKILEENDDLGWMSGTRATLRNTGTPMNRTTSPEIISPVYIPETDSETDSEADLEDRPTDVEETREEAETTAATPQDAAVADRAAAPEQSGGTPASATPSVASPEDPVQVLRRQGLYVGGFGSWHQGGAVFAFGDGRVVFLQDGIDQRLYERLGHRADGQLLDARSLEP